MILEPAPFVPMCTCKDFATREQPCKHVFAVRSLIEGESPGAPEPVVSISADENAPGDAGHRQGDHAPRPTYKQDWPAYNAAQIHEKAKFQTLLSISARESPYRPPVK